MRLGYIRVSSTGQNLSSQKEKLKNYNIQKWFEEKKSARDTERPVLEQLLDFAREGDEIYISDYSRIARNVKDLIDIVERCNKEKIKLVSIRENFDTTTPTGRLILNLLGSIHQFEREIILEKQREGIRIAKEKGVYKGRKEIKKPSNFDEVYLQWSRREITSKKAQELLGLKPNTFYKFIKQKKEDKI